ncbi:YfhO family protein [Dokdonia sp. Hel_I_53]|uniref:YfhO family protein n=1 Tax=Dokdonia sp. Hel_I_53 TaxID=1566287 RepID=UPI00119BE484|nr:YfhO family protein [Dokdonia sp. Hel_I_53]TVZ51715.1 membrane protein YfhO [Dokdonia sp. Hel_I_53]
MNKIDFKKVLPHLLVILGFIVVALLYFSPVLSGKRIYQNDIKLYEGMAKQHRDFREATGEETFWTNSAFGGMPTYQMGAYFPYDFMDSLDRAIRFLPRPADYLFLYFISFYVLMLVMRVPWKLATVGALAFGLSTYLIIIIGVGHNSKVHAIGYFPLVLSGILLTFQKRYLWGFLLTAIAMGLEIQANHYQMTYYLGLLCIIIGIAFLIDAVKRKELPHFFKSVGLLVIAVILGVATNASTILATAEYAKTSVRGEQLLKDELAMDAPDDGLDYDYITQWSYGKLESLNLIAPKFMGTGTAADLGRESAFAKKLKELNVLPNEINYYAQGTRLYWGEQPFVEAPPYLGVTVFVLALLGLLLINGRLRWWLLAGMLFSLILSWGKNADGITRFFVEYVPLYNKFRAVTSIQVLLELLLPIAAIIGLHRFFNDRLAASERTKKLFIAIGTVAGLLVILYLFSGSLFNLRSTAEAQMAVQQPEILDAIKEDRLTILKSDVLRSLLFVLMVGVVLWLSIKEKFSHNLTIITIGALIVFDLVGVDRRSVNEDNFITERQYQQNFQATEIDKQIMEDESYFRVIDLARGFSNSHTSYYFNSLNGYSAVQPRRMDDLYYKQIAPGNIEVLNMYNVKYILQETEQGMALNENPDANGPAWFVNEIQYVRDYTAEFAALEKVDTKNTVLLRETYRDVLGNFQPQRDSTAVVQVQDVQPNKIVYQVENSKDGFIVFAENYYENGWIATIDGVESEIYSVNYALRGLKVPAGTHEIVMSFEPQVVQTGGSIMLGSSILLLLLIVGGVFYTFKSSKAEEQTL